MLHSDEILEKILRQSQLTGIIESANKTDIKELLKEIQVWMEIAWEKYFQESKFNTTQSLEIIKLRQKIDELMTENQKLTNLLNANI